MFKRMYYNWLVAKGKPVKLSLFCTAFGIEIKKTMQGELYLKYDSSILFCKKDSFTEKLEVITGEINYHITGTFKDYDSIVEKMTSYDNIIFKNKRYLIGEVVV